MAHLNIMLGWVVCFWHRCTLFIYICP